MVDLFLVQPVFHNWCVTKAVLSCLWDDAYKRTLAANRKSTLCGGNGFPLSVPEWSIYHMSDAI